MALTLSPLARNIQDSLLKANLAAPNANANTLGATLDLECPNAAFVNERISLIANVPNLPNVANATTVTLTVEHADANANANFSSLGLTATLTAGASGVAAQLVEFRLPGNAKRYVRIKAAGGSGAGAGQTETITQEIRS